MKVSHQSDYRKKRAAAYPEINEQLEALWKAISADNKPLPPETREVFDRIAAVKAKYPKPAGKS